MFGHLDRGFFMAEPVNHTLHVLREFREEFREFVAKTDRSFDALEKKVDRNHEELKQRIEPPSGGLWGKRTWPVCGGRS